MNQDIVRLPIDLAERVEIANAKGCYAPALSVLDCVLHIPLYSHTDGGYPFIFEESLPTELHAYINKKSIGSAIPLLESGKDAYWAYDIERWLNALGIGIAEVEPVIYLNK